MRTRVIGAVIVALGAIQAVPADAAPVVSDIVVAPLKDGSRVAVTWRTQVPTIGFVTYGPVAGTDLVAPPVGAREHVDAGTEHLVLIDLLPTGERYHLTVTAIGDGGTTVGDPVSFEARNAMNAFDEDARAYRVNLLMRFDWDLTDAEMDAWEEHAREFARRVNDMTDGWVRLGTLILADSVVHDVNWSQECTTTDCLSGADVVVFTGFGMSIYTPAARVTAMWQQSRRGGISAIGSAIEFPRYVFWDEDLPVDMTTEWWTGRRLAHEFGHYGLWLVDQYESPTCENGQYDISIMNNDLYSSEIDSIDTPCEWQQSGARNSWDTYFSPRYERVAPRRGPPALGPTGVGSFFRLVSLNRGVA